MSEMEVENTKFFHVMEGYWDKEIPKRRGMICGDKVTGFYHCANFEIIF